MVINIQDEHLIAIRDVPRAIEALAGCRAPHRRTVYRWIVAGVGDRKLEAIRIGGKWHTSREALIRFFTLGTEVPGL